MNRKFKDWNGWRKKLSIAMKKKWKERKECERSK